MRLLAIHPDILRAASENVLCERALLQLEASLDDYRIVLDKDGLKTALDEAYAFSCLHASNRNNPVIRIWGRIRNHPDIWTLPLPSDPPEDLKGVVKGLKRGSVDRQLIVVAAHARSMTVPKAPGEKCLELWLAGEDAGYAEKFGRRLYDPGFVTELRDGLTWVEWKYLSDIVPPEEMRPPPVQIEKGQRVGGLNRVPLTHQQLYTAFQQAFEEEELQDLCYRLKDIDKDIKYENLKGSVKNATARNLIKHFINRNRYYELEAVAVSIRPDIERFRSI